MDMSNVAERLLLVFGAGERPEIRKRLYSRLEREVIAHGEPVYDQIVAAAADARDKVHPGRYFARAVVARLRQRGYLGGDPLEWNASD